jgi:hypothetical protein
VRPFVDRGTALNTKLVKRFADRGRTHAVADQQAPMRLINHLWSSRHESPIEKVP